MIDIFWKKVCDSKGVTPSWEHKNCKEQIVEIERKISNSEQYIIELEARQSENANRPNSENFVCLRTKKSIERHESNLEKFQKERSRLVEKLINMKLDFGKKQ